MRETRKLGGTLRLGTLIDCQREMCSRDSAVYVPTSLKRARRSSPRGAGCPANPLGREPRSKASQTRLKD